ncbi:cupin domain-containing protein [Sphingobacterium sp. SGG-5]|uniref:phosphomannose isomerase type II C-terminal cupin domain n=1 Tax=Sphingobacterium sp. SGG-5 TaxID=2710881 RepID=UPI0013EA285D|nr:phosphomannose isomerase type II C-terminal cupin domain [Sphingobacterium sp. SGG-5]NGM61090.1 cupin domain-containing protein [Sphingobacterium sp. SGG-5]
MNYKTKFIPSEKPDVAFVSRPWGTFKQFANNEASTVSLMTMLPGQRMSLQSHVGRAELWIVIDDGATIQVGDRIWEAQAGEEVWIPAEERHRLSNRGNQPIRVLEVAFGNWQQEDIQRYEDDYQR